MAKLALVRTDPRTASIKEVYDTFVNALTGKATNVLTHFEMMEQDNVKLGKGYSRRWRGCVAAILFNALVTNVLLFLAPAPLEGRCAAALTVDIVIFFVGLIGWSKLRFDPATERIRWVVLSEDIIRSWIHVLPLRTPKLDAPEKIRECIEDAILAEQRFAQDNVAEYIAIVHECNTAFPQIIDAWSKYDIGVKLGRIPPRQKGAYDPTSRFISFEQRIVDHVKRAEHLAKHLDDPMLSPEFKAAFNDADDLHRQIFSVSWHRDLHGLGFSYETPTSTVLQHRVHKKRVGGSYRVAPTTVRNLLPGCVPQLPPSHDEDETSEPHEPSRPNRNVVH